VIEILNPAGQKTIVLQGRHLKWLNDGQSFLAHVGDLAAIGLDAVCRHCLAAGVCDPVRALLLGDGHYMEVACRHHAGKVKVDGNRSTSSRSSPRSIGRSSARIAVKKSGGITLLPPRGSRWTAPARRGSISWRWRNRWAHMRWQAWVAENVWRND
jgi:hypothetical protein